MEERGIKLIESESTPGVDTLRLIGCCIDGDVPDHVHLL